MLCYVLSYYGVSIINQSIWKCAHSAADWSSFKSLRNQYHKLILSCKKDYYSSLVSSASDNPKRLWQTVNKLLHGKKKSSSPLPTTSPGTSLAESFAFFTGKISKKSLTSNPATSSPHSSPPGFSKNVHLYCCFHNHRYCQPLPHVRPVSSHSRGIRYLTTTYETRLG